MKDVKTKELITHADQRGYFREIIRTTDPFFDDFGQWSHSMMTTGTIKAWHIHQIQTDYWYVPIGSLLAVLYDTRRESPSYGLKEEYLLGQEYGPIVLKIPTGVAHGCKVLQGPCHLFYVTSHVYNLEDEGRLPFDSESIAYDWFYQEVK